jgi:hypothetical protein
MQLAELDLDQRRRFIDASQVFQAWRKADREFRDAYRGSMHWKSVRGRQYLYRVIERIPRSLGARSAETERIKADYTDQRSKLKRRLTSLAKRLEDMDTMNRAAGLGRLPTIAARILRKLDQEGLLGRHLFVVGTHSLFAYEAATGVIFDKGLTATGDVDLLWDVRQKLKLAMVDVRVEGVLGLLRRVDRSFVTSTAPYRATNEDGYYVDLIRPMQPNKMISSPTFSDAPEDLEAAAIAGQWLINAPKFEQIVMGADGRPLWVSCVDPRAFALHKYWLSKRPDREGIKRQRDARQARAAAQVATAYLGLEFNAKDLSALPIAMVRGAKELIATARKGKEKPKARPS